MRLRATTDRLLPVKPDERRLSPELQKISYSGSYFLSGGVNQVYIQTDERKPEARTFVERSWLRMYEGYLFPLLARSGPDAGMHFSRYKTVSFPDEEAVAKVYAESFDERVLPRATRVERVARRVKALSAVTLAAAACVVGAVEHVDLPIAASAITQSAPAGVELP